jgi:hypothetical protein
LIERQIWKKKEKKDEFFGCCCFHFLCRGGGEIGRSQWVVSVTSGYNHHHWWKKNKNARGRFALLLHASMCRICVRVFVWLCVRDWEESHDEDQS